MKFFVLFLAIALSNMARAQELATPSPPPAPSQFYVKFETTVTTSNGSTAIILQVNREWAPIGVDHFYELMQLTRQQDASYYDSNGFFRVVPGFVVQFGISGTPAISKAWNTPIKDDPVKQSNVAGTMTYADAGPNTRTTQLFINYIDNSGLDSQGFAPFAKVVQGMDVALAINSQYGQSPSQNQIYSQGNSYLKKHYPDLDYIVTASIFDPPEGFEFE